MFAIGIYSNVNRNANANKLDNLVKNETVTHGSAQHRLQMAQPDAIDLNLNFISQFLTGHTDGVSVDISKRTNGT